MSDVFESDYRVLVAPLLDESDSGSSLHRPFEEFEARRVRSFVLSCLDKE